MIYINKSVWVKKIVNLNGGPDLKECDGQNVMNFYDSLKKLVGPEIRQQNIFIRMWDTTTYEGFTSTSFFVNLGSFFRSCEGVGKNYKGFLHDRPRDWMSSKTSCTIFKVDISDAGGEGGEKAGI